MLDAQAAINDGANIKAVRRIAKIGAGGRCPQNAERDLHRLLRQELKIPTELYDVSVPVHGPDNRVRFVTQQLVLPHELFSDMYACSPEKFNKHMINDEHLLLEWLT